MFILCDHIRIEFPPAVQDVKWYATKVLFLTLAVATIHVQ